MKRTCRLTILSFRSVLITMLIGLLVSPSWIHLESPLRFKGGLYRLSEPIDQLDKVSYLALQKYFCRSEEASLTFPAETVEESCAFFTKVMIGSFTLMAMQILTLVCLFIGILSLTKQRGNIKLWHGPVAGALGYFSYIISLLLYLEQNSLSFNSECTHFDTVCAGHSVIISFVYGVVFFFVEVLHGVLVAKYYFFNDDGYQEEQETAESRLCATNIDNK